jgi:nucleoside-diphosphate-sugar epimerase
MKAVIVTGSAGFVGSQSAKRFARESFKTEIHAACAI